MFDDSSPIKRPSLADHRGKLSQDDDSWSHAADLGSRQNSYDNPFVRNDVSKHSEVSGFHGVSSSSPLSTAFGPSSDTSRPVEKHVRWTPSVTGGSSTTGSPPASPVPYHPTLDSLSETNPESSESCDPTPSELDKFEISQEYLPGLYGGHGGPYPSAPPVVRQAPVLPPPPPPEDATLLTDAVVAKVQKHCRFAISSLDYEDAEQARRELRAALALLGGQYSSE